MFALVEMCTLVSSSKLLIYRAFTVLGEKNIEKTVEDMIKVAVTSAMERTTLRPFCLFVGMHAMILSQPSAAAKIF